MRIVYDYQTFSVRQYGGISRYFVELVAALGRMDGVDVRVVGPVLASQFLADRRAAVHVMGIDVSGMHWLPTRVARDVNRVLFPLVAVLARPEIVHETNYAPVRIPRGAKIVTTLHDTIPERLPQLFPEVEAHRARIYAALKRADRVICVSESTQRDVLELYKVDAAKVRVVHLASSLQPVDEAKRGRAEPYFLHVGARYHYKNFGVLVEAFRRSGLWRTHQLAVFSLQGLTREEWRAVDRAGIPRGRMLEMSGDDLALARAYMGAEALIFPSLYEGFGIPVVEAMRCGCPVITSAVSSLPEVGGDAALYCDPQEPESFAVAMRRVAEDRKLRAEMTARGRERAERFSWKRCARETLAVYEELLRQ